MEKGEAKSKKPPRLCCICNERRPVLKRAKTLQQICRECFYEEEIHQAIVKNRLFKSGERVAIGASGGKDSTVLAYVLSELNRRHSYGLDLFLLSIDEGITGYRDDSLETVKRNELQVKIESVHIDHYSWGVCRLSRCTSITTGEDGPIPRCKPFKYTYEKEIVMYAYFKKLDYFSTECIYSPNAYRGFAREFIKDLERLRPRAILDIIKSGEDFRIATTTKMPEQGTCERCGYISSQKWCKACVLLDGLNRGLPKMGIGRARGGGVNGGDHKKETTVKTLESKQCGSLDF